MALSTNNVVIARLAAGMYGYQLGATTMAGAVSDANGTAEGIDALMNTLYARDFAGASDASVASALVANLGITGAADAAAAAGVVESALAGAAAGQKGAAIANLVNLFAGLSSDPTWGGYATAFNTQISRAIAYAGIAGTADVPVSAVVPTFTLAAASAAGADVMRLTGNMDVLVDFTNPANQVTGLDLNGNGVIQFDGVERSITGRAANYEIVDAYSRNPLNHLDTANNFLGDIVFKGEGFEGDGVNTNGNIFLGGLGTDDAKGGDGNDFLAGGGIAQGRVGMDVLSGGRNADFFFGQFAAGQATDGTSLMIDGGNTADDNSAGNGQSAQDSDWLLLEATDDDEPVQVWLNDDNVGLAEPGDGILDNKGRVLSRSGQSMVIDDVENLDASGNLYGMLNDMDVKLGARASDLRDTGAGNAGGMNNGYGSSAQLNVIGSNAGNIIIGGYDNDYINGGAGSDLLMGGNLNYLSNPNLAGIWNNGRDELVGGADADDIVFETDGGIYEGGATVDADDADTDTLWLTKDAFGTRTAAEVTSDGTLRIDLAVGKIGGLDNAAGYGGADKNSSNGGSFTSDQTNYAAGYDRTQVQDFENVIATGLGSVDYLASGANKPELLFNNQQNHLALTGSNLDLRGTDGANVLYAVGGDDMLEGRMGNDSLSGGDGNDDFYFQLADSVGDGVDVIHRQTDANSDNLWDTDADDEFLYERDFGQGVSTTTNSKLTLTLVDSANPVDLSGFPVNGVKFTLDGVAHLVSLTSGIQGTYAAFNTALNAAMDAVPALAALNSVLNADNTMTITDPAGKAFGTAGYTFVDGVVPPSGTLTWNQTIGDPNVSRVQDRLIYKSYEDRSDNEGADDGSVVGSTIALGVDSYAEDLVIDFTGGTTRIAEDQSYALKFKNLTTEDRVTVVVNGVTYSLQVGVDLDGVIIAAEDGVGDTQAGIQTAFLARLASFMTNFMDDDTSAGAVNVASNGVDTLTVTQRAYNGEETVFMVKPVVDSKLSGHQLSGGEPWSATVTNVSQHEVELFEFDGRNGELNDTNVLFVGDTGENRANLRTIKDTGETVAGTEAIVIDSGVNDLQAMVFGTTTVVFDNTATNAPLMAANFAAHGDDFLLGGKGNDIINAGTGDDRVEGSIGTDAVDGGKNFYAVKVLGEAQSRVYILNNWEAANPSKVAALSALTISSITLINQTESGTGLVSGIFDDTLQFSQRNFDSAMTRFTVTLNDYTLDGTTVQLRNDGAGTVGVDVDGNGTIDHTTTFKNFENIRTVSGSGNAVAGGGQGYDTLDVTAMSNMTTGAGGISYNLTTGANAGKVKYSADAIITAPVAPVVAGSAAADKPVAGDYEVDVLRVDGVENVKSGTGHDLLLIDHTEAAKDNRFEAGLGTDRVEYLNDFVAGANNDGTAQPTITIAVNTATDTDSVTSKGGRVGVLNTASGGAVDTLVGVEYIALGGETARSTREDDVLDVTAMVTGAIVDYTNGEIRTGAVGVGVQLVVEGIVQLENVWADGNDTVIVADAAVMNTNLRSDELNATPAQNILFMNYLDYDELNTAATTRKSFAAQVAGTTIQQVINQGQFTFDLSRVGTDVDVDRVDYSNEAGRIVVPVGQATATTPQYVVVDGDNDQNFADAESRVDALVSVEEIVAAKGKSVMDFTAVGQARQITFQYVAPAANPAENGMLEQTIRIADGSGNALTGLNAFVERYTYNKTTPAVADATWNQVEGSDAAEVIIYQGSEDLVNQAGLDHRYTTDVLTLRGGNNEVRYSPLETSITVSITVVEEDLTTTNASEGKITAAVTFQNGLGAALPGGGSHTITSHTSDNTTAAGNLKIEGSQDAEDTVSFTATGNKTFILGSSPGVVNVTIGSLSAIVLTGFEFLADPVTNDVYTFASLASTFGLSLTDNGAQDHDTVKVGNDAIGFNTGTALNIDLNWISSNADGGDADALPGFNFDFDVLDVTGVTTSGLTLVGGTNAAPANADVDATDEVVLGALSLITATTGFESVVLTQASTTAGTNFTFNPGADTLAQGSTTVSTTANELSFGGLVLEQTGWGNSYVPDVTTAVNVTVAGNAGATVHGGAGADTITGGSVADVIRGNGGNDMLSGGISAEVRTLQVDGISAGAGGVQLTFNAYNNAAETDVVAGVDFLLGAGADAIGAALAAKITANLAAINLGAAWTNGSLVTATYDSGTDLMTFTFTTGADVLVGEAITAVETLGGTFAVEATAATAIEGGNGGADRFVFEATAAANGADSISAVTVGAGGDVLDFTAFFGGATVFAGAATDAALGTTVATGNAAVLFNKAAFVASDIVVGAPAAGQIQLANNGKAVVVVTGDVDGVGGGLDLVNDAYKVYFIEDTDAGAGQTYTVTLVGTVGSAAELDAADWIGANFA